MLAIEIVVGILMTIKGGGKSLVQQINNAYRGDLSLRVNYQI